MKRGLINVVLALAIAMLAVLFVVRPFASDENSNAAQYYVGVAFCGNTTKEAEMLTDRVKGYTNLFILQSGPVSVNETATNEICDYAVAAKLNIIVYFGDLDPAVLARKNLTWRTSWVNSARSRWGKQFLGVYYYDERGGIYLDTDKNATQWHLPPNSTYDSVAAGFINGFLRDPGTVGLKSQKIPIFASDYVLYWFDYLSGYDVVLGQVGWNHSLVQDVALLRGASNLQHKDWGAIITWKYDVPPYLASGDEIYEQMVSVYESGAKYIAIFNYPYSDANGYGTMRDEHFLALEKFWNDVTDGSKVAWGSINADAVLVLQRNYGWGMRNPEDTIWGFWGTDEKSPQIWELSRKLISSYGFRLDIVYDDLAFPFAGEYAKVYNWDSSVPN
jgi:hypothetical protein